MFKKVFYSFVLTLSFQIIFPNLVKAQLKKGLKLIEKSDFQSAEQAFLFDLERDKNKALVAWELAKLHTHKKYEEKDLDKARTYAQLSLESFDQAPSKDRQNWQKQGLSRPRLQKFFKDLSSLVFAQNEKQPSLEAWNHFIEHYPQRSTREDEKAQQYRNTLAWQAATKTNTHQAYKQVWDCCQASFEKHNPNLFNDLERWLFKSYTKEKGLRSYGDFVLSYPKNPFSLDTIAAVAFILSAEEGNWDSYQNFVQRYGQSVFTLLAAETLLDLAEQGQNLAYYDAWLRQFDKHYERLRAWRGFWQLQQGQKNWAKFLEEYPHCPFSQKELEIEK